MVHAIKELRFVIKEVGDNRFLEIDHFADNPFGSRLWMLESVVGSVLADKSGVVLQKILSGEGFGYDGFAYYPPNQWGEEKLVDLSKANQAFFNQFDRSDLWIVGTNYEDDRFAIVPRSYLLEVLRVYEYFRINGKLPDD